jgi:cystathionine beta-lyase
MAIRLAQHQSSALTIAKWLKSRPEVAQVLHPALPDCPGHDLFVRDFKGSSGLFSFVLNGRLIENWEASRAALIDALQLFGIGYSWGGFESLAIPGRPAAPPQRHAARCGRADGAPANRPRRSSRPDRRSRSGIGCVYGRAGVGVGRVIQTAASGGERTCR